MHCRCRGAVKRERVDFPADHPLHPKRFAQYPGPRRVSATTKGSLPWNRIWTGTRSRNWTSSTYGHNGPARAHRTPKRSVNIVAVRDLKP